MSALGYDAGGAGPGGSPAGIGRCIGEHYIARGLEDGSNEQEDYKSAAYRPVNPSLEPRHPGNHDLLDPNRWQPMGLRLFVDQAGNPADGIHEFVTPEWGRVLPFALGEDDLTVHKRDGADYYVYHDPGPPPTSPTRAAQSTVKSRASLTASSPREASTARIASQTLRCGRLGW